MKIVFLTGTRADYGKLKPLMQICDKDNDIETYVFIAGMHLLQKYGLTCNDIFADGYKNIYKSDAPYSERMDENLANTILSFSNFIHEVEPDLIVVHGDRGEPLAASIVGVLNNIRVAHVEGGEVTGTADEFMRHAISKLSNFHFVSNDESKYRLIQLGESENNIFVIGSPDIDIMLSSELPSFDFVKQKYEINYDNFGILIYHPVTTSINLKNESRQVVSAVIDSGKKYIVIRPNNDHGADVVVEQLLALQGNPNFMMFKSIVFEDFLVLLKNCDFIIGNSSAGIREACVYGVPAIDIGSRQNKRYTKEVLRNVQKTEAIREDIISCIQKIEQYKYKSFYFGSGKSAASFLEIVKQLVLEDSEIQKTFVDLDVTSVAIKNYVNEVCF